MADQDPVFQIQRVYLKEASLEQPNSPAILLEQEQPNVDIQLGVEATPVAEGVFAGKMSLRRSLSVSRVLSLPIGDRLYGETTDRSPSIPVT